MRRETQHLLLLFVGGAIVKISLNGTFERYVKPALGPWLTLTGSAVVILALVLIVHEIRTRPVPAAHAPLTADAPHPREHAGGGHKHPVRMGWLLLVPALLLLFAPPPILAVEKPTSHAAIPVVSTPRFSDLPSGTAALGLLDFVGRTLSAPQTVQDRDVELVGSLRLLPDGVFLTRIFIWCCVADARAAVIRLDPTQVLGSSRSLPAVHDKQWVRLRATYLPGSVSTDPDRIPTVHVASLTIIPEPDDPYEH